MCWYVCVGSITRFREHNKKKLIRGKEEIRKKERKKKVIHRLAAEVMTLWLRVKSNLFKP